MLGKKKIEKSYKKIVNLKFFEIGIGSGVIFISILKEYKKYFEKLKNEKYFKDIEINLFCHGIDINSNSCKLSNINSELMKISTENFKIENISLDDFFKEYHKKEKPEFSISEFIKENEYDSNQFLHIYPTLNKEMKEENKKFDFIISNPPYIKNKFKSNLQKEVILYEDPKALFSGEDGLDLIKKIVSISRKIVKKGGFVILEIDEDQNGYLVDIMMNYKFHRFFTEKDIFRKERFFIYYVN